MPIFIPMHENISAFSPLDFGIYFGTKCYVRVVSVTVTTSDLSADDDILYARLDILYTGSTLLYIGLPPHFPRHKLYQYRLIIKQS